MTNSVWRQCLFYTFIFFNSIAFMIAWLTLSKINSRNINYTNYLYSTVNEFNYDLYKNFSEIFNQQTYSIIYLNTTSPILNENLGIFEVDEFYHLTWFFNNNQFVLSQIVFCSILFRNEWPNIYVKSIYIVTADNTVSWNRTFSEENYHLSFIGERIPFLNSSDTLKVSVSYLVNATFHNNNQLFLHKCFS